jgi:Zn-dependent peptidase ImmA (M78 family)
VEVRIITNAYKLYKDARDASWRCLINTRAAEMPIKVLKVAAFCGVKVVKDSNAHYLKSGESGCTLVDSAGNWQIVYRDTENRGRTRFTVAHELGHILLGHELAPDKSGHFRTASDRREPAETQADEFAARLLAPACVLWGLEAYEPEEIARICDISAEAAGYRAKRMKELRGRGKFLTSPLERQVFEAFRPWIEQQKSRPE